MARKNATLAARDARRITEKSVGLKTLPQPRKGARRRQASAFAKAMADKSAFAKATARQVRRRARRFGGTSWRGKRKRRSYCGCGFFAPFGGYAPGPPESSIKATQAEWDHQ